MLPWTGHITLPRRPGLETFGKGRPTPQSCWPQGELGVGSPRGQQDCGCRDREGIQTYSPPLGKGCRAEQHPPIRLGARRTLGNPGPSAGACWQCNGRNEWSPPSAWAPGMSWAGGGAGDGVASPAPLGPPGPSSEEEPAPPPGFCCAPLCGPVGGSAGQRTRICPAAGLAERVSTPRPRPAPRGSPPSWPGQGPPGAIFKVTLGRGAGAERAQAAEP